MRRKNYIIPPGLWLVWDEESTTLTQSHLCDSRESVVCWCLEKNKSCFSHWIPMKLSMKEKKDRMNMGQALINTDFCKNTSLDSQESLHLSSSDNYTFFPFVYDLAISL